MESDKLNYLIKILKENNLKTKDSFLFKFFNEQFNSTNNRRIKRGNQDNFNKKHDIEMGIAEEEDIDEEDNIPSNIPNNIRHITRQIIHHRRRIFFVKSLRLTMQSGMAIQDPQTPRVLLPELQTLELVGGMEVRSDYLSRLFPSLERFDFQKQDLITGLIQRARVLSNFDFVIEPNINPIAAAC
uniref:Uncharacterized protein n=1 Tax=Meloidogyne hapla TaxID=6305 RepID=A0A1I8B0Q6_MELHA